MEESFIKRYWRALTIIALIIGTLLNIYMVFTDFCKQCCDIQFRTSCNSH